MTDYKVNIPANIADRVKAEELAKDAGFQTFLGKLHGAGASQAVVDAAVGEMLERGVKLREAKPALDEANCVAELKGQEGWKSDAEYTQQVSTAFRAGQAIFGKDFDGIVKDYGNDPRLIRGLASIGKEMAEDLPPSAEAQAQIQESLDAVMNTKAYLNGNDPGHAAAMAKVEALTKRVAGTRAVTGGKSMSFKT